MLNRELDRERVGGKSSSKVWGYLFLTMGIIPGALWVLDYVDFVRPGSRPEEWPIILMSLFLVAVGMMLIEGEGDSIRAAFMSWFQKKTGS